MRRQDNFGVWEDTTGYSRDAERIPSCWTMTLMPGFKITVLNSHIYHKGEWVMHCEPWFNTRQIPAATEEQAKAMALDQVAQKIDALGRALLKVQNVTLDARP